MSLNRQIVTTLSLLVTTILFFTFSSVDMLVQDSFFDRATHLWILGHEDEPYKFIFYDGIKKLLILIAVSFLFSLIFFRKKKLVKRYKKGIFVVVFSAILVPITVGALKKETNMPCPKNEIHYGGVYPKTAVWESYPKEFQESNIRCWPAGHASGGFALLSLFFLFKSRKSRIKALILALTIGWSMGIYKMLICDHFLSHTVITMLLAWLIILVVQKVITLKKFNSFFD